MGFIGKGTSSNATAKKVLGKASEKFGKIADKLGLPDLLDDAGNAIKSTANGFASSIGDLVKSKNKRNNKDTDTNFTQKEVSIANEHHDEITNILSGVASGNLLDAGLNALNLFNFGTKWWIYTDQHVDKELYPFRYYYYSDSTSGVGGLTSSETGVPDLSVLDSIEDPTILGYTIKVDFENSPLFGGQPNSKFKGYTLLQFVRKYSIYYPELKSCENLLREFTKMFALVFQSMESLLTQQYKNRPYKPHYISKIEGLSKLDNPFVSINDDSEDELKITLCEDVRLSSTRMAMLYRNLTYSYNMGKKLIPANFLRFKMYIKLSDQRTFTSGSDEKNKFRDAVRNGYSRVIYELCDCEMSFNGPMPDSITVGGIGGNSEQYATTSMSIKYKKVNRIFYSALFDKNMLEYVITDKFWDNTNGFRSNVDPTNDADLADEKAKKFLKSTGFEGRMHYNTNSDDVSKRRATSNNIDVVPSLRERYSNLKNGLLSTDDNDTAITRFIKTQSNNAVTKGMSFVDEGLDKLRDKIDDAGVSIRDRLKFAISNKTVNLGKLYTSNNDKTQKPDIDNIDAGSYLEIKPINLQHLHSAETLNTTAPSRNLNANELSYFNANQIGLEHLQDAVNNNEPIVPANLQNAVTVNHNLPIDDFMVGQAQPPFTTKIDLMVGDVVANTPAKEDLMVGEIVTSTPAKEDLMVGEIVANTPAKEDLMVGEIVANTPAKEDLMVTQAVSTNPQPNDLMTGAVIDSTPQADDLMVAQAISPNPQPNDLMTGALVNHALPIEDLMVSDANPTTLQPNDLMVPSVSENPLQPIDLMVAGDLPVLPLDDDLMVATGTPEIMPLVDLMIPTGTISAPVENQLMMSDKNDKEIFQSDLMSADTYTVKEPDGDLMVPSPEPPMFKKFLL